MKIYKKRQSIEYRKLSYRFTKLRYKFAILEHYWRIRCKERKTLYKSLKNVNNYILRIKNLEKVLGAVFGQKKFIVRINAHRNKKEKFYPVFLSHNQILRLRTILKYKKRKGLLNE